MTTTDIIRNEIIECEHRIALWNVQIVEEGRRLADALSKDWAQNPSTVTELVRGVSASINNKRAAIENEYHEINDLTNILRRIEELEGEVA